MRAVRLAVVAALLSLIAPLAVVASTTAGASAQSSTQASAPVAAVGAPTATKDRASKRKGNKWAPPTGALLSDPLIPGRDRNILRRVITSIYNTASGEFIRVVVWNYDECPGDQRPARRRPARGPRAGSGRGLGGERQLGQDPRPAQPQDQRQKLRREVRGRVPEPHQGHAREVHPLQPRPPGPQHQHVRVLQPDRARRQPTVERHGHHAQLRSLQPAGPGLRAVRVGPNLARPYLEADLGKYKLTLWPAFNRNPILTELKQVACTGATGGAGNDAGRTKIRIAIAGWFDDFGTDIARQVRNLWERGCDIKIITTLAGRGVNRTLKNPAGRGPVPIRMITQDTNADGIPERYLHMKNIAISGVYAGDTAANVLITGSPNWSRNAQNSDEIMFRITKATKMVRQYFANTDRLFYGPAAHVNPLPIETEETELLRRAPRAATMLRTCAPARTCPTGSSSTD